MWRILAQAGGIAALAVLAMAYVVFGRTPPGIAGEAFASGNEFSGKVVRIVDGDGIVLDSGVEVRLGDFNAPEWNERGGGDAKRALRAIAFGRTVECRRCEGARRPGRCTSYDRVIATCRLVGRRLGDLMREGGVIEGGR